jgi:hypothetical protein
MNNLRAFVYVLVFCVSLTIVSTAQTFTTLALFDGTTPTEKLTSNVRFIVE